MKVQFDVAEGFLSVLQADLALWANGETWTVDSATSPWRPVVTMSITSRTNILSLCGMLEMRYRVGYVHLTE